MTLRKAFLKVVKVLKSSIKLSPLSTLRGDTFHSHVLKKEEKKVFLKK